MARAHFHDVIASVSGASYAVVASASVKVCAVGTTTATTDTIYGSRTGGSVANPFTATASGVAEFWTDEPGAYTLQISGSGITTFTQDIETIDVGDLRNGVFNVKDAAYGAKGDGSTDDTTAINTAITDANAVGGSVKIPAGTYIVSGVAGGSAIVAKSNVTIIGDGPTATVLKAKAATDFQDIIGGSTVTGVTIRDLGVDGNQANRVSQMTGVMTGIYMTGATDCTIDNCYASNIIGTVSASGNALSFSGASTRCTISNSRAIDCGVTGKPADAFYISGGSGHTIIGCKAMQISAGKSLDTGFVLANTSMSGIYSCVSNGQALGSIAGIASSTASLCTANQIVGVVGYDYGTSAAGAIQIITTSTGQLTNTIVSDVILERTSGSGPGIVVTATSSGNIDGLLISGCQIKGSAGSAISIAPANTVAATAALQNILIAGNHLLGTFSGNPIGFTNYNGTISNVDVSNNKILATATPGIDSDAVSTLNVLNNTILGTPTYYAFFHNTATGCAFENNRGASVSQKIVGSDAGTTPFVVSRGTGSPESNIIAAVGSQWMRTDGGAATSFYVKESGSGNTGWQAK